MAYSLCNENLLNKYLLNFRVQQLNFAKFLITDFNNTICFTNFTAILACWQNWAFIKVNLIHFPFIIIINFQYFDH